MAGSEPIDGLAVDSGVLAAALATVGLVLLAAAALAGRRRADPFLDAGWFRAPSFASAALVSLLTGYGLATAIIGGAVFVDRVLYGGPDLQRIALGSLAACHGGRRARVGPRAARAWHPADHAHWARRGDRGAGADGRLDAGDVARRGGRVAGAVRGEASG